MDLKTALWCDLTTDAERSAWLLLGRGYETGVVAKAIQNDLALAYQRLGAIMSGDHNQYQKPDLQCARCGEVNPAEIHTCTPMRPEQEPVAWLDSLDRSQPHAVTGFQYLTVSQIERGEQHKYIPVYAAPPRESGCGECGKKASDGWALYCVECSAPMREWIGLTDEEAAQCWNTSAVQTWKAIEARLKDKNR